MTAQAPILSVDDFVARCAINPRILRNKRFHHAYLLDFDRVKGTFDFATSVGWRSLLSTDDEVHAYGCRSAAFSNSNKASPPEPLVSAAHYIGFYDLAVGSAVDESNDIYEVFVEQIPENGEDAHCHIVLRERSNLTKDQQKLKSARRSDIFFGIWDKMSGPSRHVCSCDDQYKEQLLKLDLPPPGTPDEE